MRFVSNARGTARKSIFVHRACTILCNAAANVIRAARRAATSGMYALVCMGKLFTEEYTAVHIYHSSFKRFSHHKAPCMDPPRVVKVWHSRRSL